MSSKKPAGPLDGIRVLDFSQAMAGPFAAQKLGDLGAEVIKVEPPGAGEWHRTRPAADAWVKDHNSSFLAFNRNKRSLAIDLKHPGAAPVLERLVKSADVVLMNFRPGVAERLKITYDDLRRHNPRIIVCSLTGYGSSGPYVKRPGQDLILQGYSGSMWNGGKEGDAPIASPLYVADATAAHIVVEGVLGALLWRERGGSGQLVEVNMLDAMVDLQVQELSVFLTGGVRPKRTKESFAHVLLTAPYGVYRTKDGYMTVSIGPIPVLGEVLDNDRLRGMKEWGDGMTYRDEIYRIVAAALPARSTAEWMERFQQHDFWVGPVYDYDDLVADPQVKHNGSFIEIDHPTEGKLKLPGIPIHYSESPGSIRYHHPAVGEQSVDVLREIGFAEKEIEALGAGGVVQLAASPGRP